MVNQHKQQSTIGENVTIKTKTKTKNETYKLQSHLQHGY